MDVQTFHERETLRRSAVLLFVLALMPCLSLCAVLAKVALYSCPEDDGFGLISVLAAVAPGPLGRLRGAGLSGKLHRGVGVDIKLVSSEDGTGGERVEIRLDEISERSRVRRGVVHG